MAAVVMDIPFKNDNCENSAVPAVALRLQASKAKPSQLDLDDIVAKHASAAERRDNALSPVKAKQHNEAVAVKATLAVQLQTEAAAALEQASRARMQKARVRKQSSLDEVRMKAVKVLKKHEAVSERVKAEEVQVRHALTDKINTSLLTAADNRFGAVKAMKQKAAAVLTRQEEVSARKAAAEERESGREAKLAARLAVAEMRQEAAMLAARQKLADAREHGRTVARRASDCGTETKSHALVERLAAAETKRQSLLEQRAETARSAGSSPTPPDAVAWTAVLGAKLLEKATAAEERVQQIQGQVQARCRSASARRDSQVAELRAGQQADSVRIGLAAEARLAAAKVRAAEALSARSVGLTPLMTLLNITPRTSETGGCSITTAVVVVPAMPVLCEPLKSEPSGDVM